MSSSIHASSALWLIWKGVKQSSARARAVARVLILAVCGLISEATAAVERLEPGVIPSIPTGKGLFVAVVDAPMPLSGVRITAESKSAQSFVFSDLNGGRNYALFVVPAGEYKWSTVKPWAYVGTNHRYILNGDHIFSFKIEEGKINYPGDFVFRPFDYGYSTRVTNRGLHVMDWLITNYPGILDRYQFSYSGHYPDPFPDALLSVWNNVGRPAMPGANSEKKSSNVLKKMNSDELPQNSVERGIAADHIFSERNVLFAELNEDGDLVAEVVRLQNGAYSLDVVDPVEGTTRSVIASIGNISDVAWKSNSRLIAQATVEGIRRLFVVDIDRAESGGISTRQRSVQARGGVHSVVPGREDEILYSYIDSEGDLVILRLDIATQAGLDKLSRFRSRSRLNRGVEDAQYWHADTEGNLQFAVAFRDPDWVVYYREDAKFVQGARIGRSDDLRLFSMTPDGKGIFATTDVGREQRDLVLFDPRTGQIGETLVSKRGIDITIPVLDRAGNLDGVAYYESGLLVEEYLAEVDQRVSDRLKALFEGKTVLTTSQSRDGRRMLLWVDGSDAPPSLYYLDAGLGRATLIDQMYPALAEVEFKPMQLFHVETDDGMTLNAFISIPAGSGPHPMVVMPHGGPVGIADRLHFDPVVQYLVSQGYAVLKVNFRGSDDQGRAFREAGTATQGKENESDIERAVDVALSRFPVDSKRICAVGASYGGFSALALAILNPDRYRCVVSIAGVVDLALRFTATDTVLFREGGRLLERIHGNPNENIEEMIEVSPVYNVGRLQAAVFLIHGELDSRVDIEHAFRFERMMQLHGKTPYFLRFPGEGHSGWGRESNIKAWKAVADFLNAQIGSVGLDEETAKVD
ncbi:MAG: alpha/beta fold hydrolase [Lysobacteraceae bacterium]